MSWARRADTIVNNGHTIQVNFGEGSQAHRAGRRLQAGAVPLPSSERAPDQRQDLSDGGAFRARQCRRRSRRGRRADGDRQGQRGVQEDRDHHAAKEGPAVKADAAINPNGLLPAKRTYYRYSGSLTTPPCSETVDWLLLTDPIQVADDDVAAFAKLYPMNARPAQKSEPPLRAALAA